MIRCEMAPLAAIAAVLFAVISLVSPAPQDFQPQSGGSRGPAVQERQPAYKDNMRVPAGNADLFAFPAEPSTIESKLNARNRTPVFIPDRCQENEILYPGDQESDWVCDCKPTFVYHPPTRKCYQMYTQGYCEDGTIIHLKPDAKHPECIRNSCTDVSVAAPRVLFKGNCATLNKEHESCRFGLVERVIGIDEKTNELTCINLTDVKLPAEREAAMGAQNSNNVQQTDSNVNQQGYVNRQQTDNRSNQQG